MARRRQEPVNRWPSWRYGPNNASGIFNSEDEVPEGWTRKRWNPDTVFTHVSTVLDRTDIIAKLLEKNIVADPRRPASYLKDLLDKQ